MRRTSRRWPVMAAVTVALVLPLTGPASPAAADPDPAALAKSITAPGVKQHLRKFQQIADANGGTRASGRPGFDASVDYVAGKLRKAGYKVTVQPFEFPYFEQLSVPVLERVSPSPRVFTPTPLSGTPIGEFDTMTQSGSGDVTGTLYNIDLTLPPAPAPSSTSGCEASDFAGFPAGGIALMQRGTCNFIVKVQNAVAAGAAGAIIFNEGQPGRTATLQGNLGVPVGIPVLGAGFDAGQNLAATAGSVIHMKTETISQVRTTYNVLADSRWGDGNKIVQLGAHLDSVLAGPGINDNGSGTAGILEVALKLGALPTRNKLRFSFWGAEELNLLGSTHYVATLPPAELAKIKLYLNFDMIASPNYALQVYDGDNSDAVGAGPGPEGSAEIEKLFEKYFDVLRQPHIGTDFTGRSDYGPFIAVGIPAGGLFTGAEVLKTPEQAALFGGTAGQPFDGCYHQSCDTIANINDKALALNTGAIATAAVVYAYSGDLPGPDTRPAATALRTQPTTDDHHDDHHGVHH
ncbi:M28 family metallopeptidase [Sphaerisporangium sp. B11E5]|uniref:M28 family metallopeptidase n=1 Tax=Sphaerisporangium sp. B11E5 TaxID=3153563 RepID=UPI00325EDC74